MMPNFKKPFSAFIEGDKNSASFATGQHYEALDLAIEQLVALYKNGYDIEDEDLFNTTLARYGLLNNGFCSEEDYIVEEVVKRIGK